MKNSFEIISEIDLEVAVFNEYKKYSSLGNVRNKESNLFNFEDLSQKGGNSRQAFIRDFSSNENDLVSIAKALNISLDVLYNTMKNNVNLLDSDYKFDKTSVITVHGKDHLNYKTYSISEIPNLYTELAKVEPFNIKSILHFVKRFGLPTGVRDFPQDFNSYDLMMMPIANYFELNHDLILYRDLFHLVQRYIRKDIKEIKQDRMNELNKILNYTELSHTKEFINNEIVRFKKLDEKDTLAYELNEIFSFYNELENQNLFKGFMYEGSNNQFIRKLSPNDLFGVAYIQLYNALINKPKLKRCKFCNHYFESSSWKMNFCAPLPFRKRSSCEMAYNNQKYKK